MPTHNWTEYIDGQHASTAQQNQWLQVEVYATIVARDAASALFGAESVGKVCLVQEDNYYYWWQGASWVPFSALGGAGAPPSCSFVTINAEGALSAETQHVNIALADRHAPALHAASHQNLGADEISVTGLSGLLADEQDAGKIKGVNINALVANRYAYYDGANITWQAAAAGGDMQTAVYDIGVNGIVDNSEKLEGSTKAQVQNHTPIAHKDRHVSTGADAFVEGDEVDCLAHVEVQKGGVTVRANGRPTINYTNTASATWTITDNAGDDRTDIQLTATNAGTYKLPRTYVFYGVAGTFYAMDEDGNIDYSGADEEGVIKQINDALA